MDQSPVNARQTEPVSKPVAILAVDSAVPFRKRLAICPARSAKTTLRFIARFLHRRRERRRHFVPCGLCGKPVSRKSNPVTTPQLSAIEKHPRARPLPSLLAPRQAHLSQPSLPPPGHSPSIQVVRRTPKQNLHRFRFVSGGTPCQPRSPWHLLFVTRSTRIRSPTCCTASSDAGHISQVLQGIGLSIPIMPLGRP